MEFTVDTNNVNLIQENQIESGEFNVTTCQFSFSNEYEGLTQKAVFTGQDGVAYLETIINGECSIPSEVLATNQVVQIGVYAYEVNGDDLVLRYSPVPTNFSVELGSYKEAQNSTPPTPTEIEQLQSQITQNANDIDILQENYGTYDTAIANLQSDVGDIKAEQITQNDNISILQSTKADKTEIPTKVSELDNDSGFIDKSVDDLTNYTKTNNLAAVAISGSYNDLSNTPTIPTATSDLINDSGFITNTVNNLTNYTLKTSTGSLIDLEINGTTYVITLSLKDVDGNVISTDTIDLPLESVVVGGSYDSVNQKIVLTLQNGNTVDIPVGALISGLQTEITSNNKLASDLVDDTNSGNKFVTTSEKQTWNAKYDKPVGGIPSTDMTSEVQTSLGKADTAVQPTDYASVSTGGTVRLGNGFTINAGGQATCNKRTYAQYESADDYYFISKATLENVITGKNLETANNKVTSLSSSSTDTQYPSAKCVYDLVGDIETILTTLDVRKRGECMSIASRITEMETHIGNIYDTLELGGADLANVNKNIVNIDAQLKDRYLDYLNNGTDEIWNNWEKVTATNVNEATLNNTVEAPMRIDLKGNTSQGENPSPSNIQTIHNVSGNNNIKVQNKNLFNENSSWNVNASIGTGSYSLGMFPFSTGGNRRTFFMICQPNTTYTFSCNTVGDRFVVFEHYSIINPLDYSSSNLLTLDNMLLNYSSDIQKEYSFTTSANAKMIAIYYSLDTIPTEIQLEQGTTATPYVSHQEQNLPITLGDTELCKIDTAQDYFYKDSGKWYLHKETGKVVFDENSTFTKWNAASSSTRNAYRIAIDGIVPYTDINKVIKVLTTKFKAVKQTGTTWVAGTISGGTVYPTNVIFFVDPDVTASGMNALVRGEPLYYVLETPTNTEITDTTLISQLEALLQAKSYNDQTNISQTNDDLPFILDITALKNI